MGKLQKPESHQSANRRTIQRDVETRIAWQQDIRGQTKMHVEEKTFRDLTDHHLVEYRLRGPGRGHVEVGGGLLHGGGGDVVAHVVHVADAFDFFIRQSNRQTHTLKENKSASCC